MNLFKIRLKRHFISPVPDNTIIRIRLSGSGLHINIRIHTIKIWIQIPYYMQARNQSLNEFKEYIKGATLKTVQFEI